MIQNVNKYPIDEIIKKDASFHYVIPKYQREYTWSYKEWEALYDDITDNQEGYFIGSIICINTGDSIYPRLEVIDGQQRLTTLCLLLLAIYRRLNEHREEMDEDDLFEISWIRKALLNSGNGNGLILQPQVQNSNLDDFSTVMYENGILKYAKKVSYYGHRKIARCFNYFLYKIDLDLNESDNPVATLLEIKKKVCNAMLVKIEVNTHSDAYILFESLNNRGTPLTAIDLMKNLIMARAEKVGLTVDECFEQWKELLEDLTDDYATQERFFRYYYNAFKSKLNEPFRKDDPKKRDPLGIVATKSNLLQIYEKLINHDLPGFLEEILIGGHIFSDLRKREDDKTPYRRALLDLARIQGVPSYQLLMFLQRNMEGLQLSEEDFIRIVNLLTIFFVRRNVTDYPGTRDLNRIFMDAIAAIESGAVTGHDIYKTVRNILAEWVASDELFTQRLNGDIYKENTGAARFILCALAQKAMTKETWTDLWEYKQYEKSNNQVYVWTIEHIFPEGENIPQVWVDMIAGGDRDLANEYLREYVHKLGNLTVTGYNSALGNYSFEQKRDRTNKEGKFIGYKNGLEINRELAVKDSWTVEDIVDRTKRLVEEVTEMFKFPDNDEKAL
ncbi:MAG: DUF262 domain-containing protein [Bacteroidales bacterium]|nr:DUF262 domain-containing protein [Bacteroidales bacterium]MBR6863263.1 DUF262 domain-containing protein [Bacteroidales bacterium]